MLFLLGFREEEVKLLGHSCGECFLCVKDKHWFCLLRKQVRDASVVQPIKKNGADKCIAVQD